jgi:hypothetical protein
MKCFQALDKQLNQFPGMCECHFTVDVLPEEIPSFQSLCVQHECQAIVIVLDEGKYATQPMLAKLINASPEKTLQTIRKLYDNISKTFNVRRIKVEVSLGSQGVPLTDQQAISLAKSCYFEFHIRLHLDLHQSLLPLKKSLNQFNAHLSNNALSKHTQHQQRFATLRYPQLGKENALVKLNQLLTFLNSENIHYDKVIKEYNIFDSKAELDQGWGNAL